MNTINCACNHTCMYCTHMNPCMDLPKCTSALTCNVGIGAQFQAWAPIQAHACTQTYINIHAWFYTHNNTLFFIFCQHKETKVNVCACIPKHGHTYIQMHTYGHIYTQMHNHMHTWTHSTSFVANAKKQLWVCVRIPGNGHTCMHTDIYKQTCISRAPAHTCYNLFHCIGKKQIKLCVWCAYYGARISWTCRIPHEWLI